MNIYHYTTVETLLLILKYKTLRFTSLSNLDDPDEGKSASLGYEEIGRFHYVSCWTKEEKESIPQWNQYADGMKGIRLGLSGENIPELTSKSLGEISLEDRMFESNWFTEEDSHFVENEIFCATSLRPSLFEDITPHPPYYPTFENVKYEDDLQPLNHVTADKFTNMEKIGIVKDTAWKFQNEVRFMVKFQPFKNSEFLQISNQDRKEFVYNRMRDTPNKIKYLDIKMSKMFFDSLEIIAGPKCSEAELEIIQLILEKYGNGLKYEKSKIRIR